MKIAIDAMGGDHAPEVVIQGAIEALTLYPQIEKLLLVGNEAQLKQLWQENQGSQEKVEFVAAASVVEMHDPATAPLRRKKDSSIAIAADLVKQGAADALVSAGNTGAAVAATTVKWRMLPGIERPGICTPIPAEHGITYLLDAGANVDAKVEHLVAYALMGTAYCRYVGKKEAPKVGLMSVGEEDHKGTDFTREVFTQLQQTPIHFAGNVEGHDLFEGGLDVIVCDGFTGNVILKTIESTAKIMFKWLKQELTATPIRKLGAQLAKPGLLAAKDRGNYEVYGGSLLLGVNGICIIAHGGSSALAIRNAIRVSVEAIESNFITNIQTQFSKELEGQ